MMTTVVLNYVRSLWPFTKNIDDDLRVSEKLVSELLIPDETKRFVFAFREPESHAAIYILCVQNLSERSAIDAERLVRCVKPGAVVAQVKEVEFELVGNNSDADEHLIPTSSLQVIKRCFLQRIGKEKYENMAGSLVLKEIFGVGFNGHLSAAKRTAEEVGSSFLILESPFINIESNNNPSHEVQPVNSQGLGLRSNNLMPQKVSSSISSGSSRYFISDEYLCSPVLKSSLSHLIQLSSDLNTRPMNIEPKDDYEAPQYARSIYPLLEDLYNIFKEIPSLRRALAYAQKMLHTVCKGDNIDTQIVSEVYAFRIAVEGLRIALNNEGRVPIKIPGNGQPCNVDFSSLPDEEKSHAIVACAIRTQTKSFKSIVAVLDAGTLAGLRKHWNTVVPRDIMDAVDELVAESAKDGEMAYHSDKRRKLKNKPVVAVGAGASAVIGVSSLSKVLPVSSLIKLVTFKVPFSLKLVITQTQKLVSLSFSKILGPTKFIAPSMFNSGLNTTSSVKAAASAEKIRAVVHSVIASAEKTSLSATRSAFYEIMRKRRIRPVGVLPWATFGCSVATCTGLLVYGDGIECAVESVPSAPLIASLGRGIESLQQASQLVEQSEISRVQSSIDSLFNRFKMWKLAP